MSAKKRNKIRFKFKGTAFSERHEDWRQRENMPIEFAKALFSSYIVDDNEYEYHSLIKIRNRDLRKLFSTGNTCNFDYLSRRIKRPINDDMRHAWIERIRILYAAISYALTELEYYFSVKNLEHPTKDGEPINTVYYANDLVVVSMIDLIFKYDKLLFLSELLKEKGLAKLNILRHLIKELRCLIRFPGYAFSYPELVTVYNKNIGGVYLWLLNNISLELCSDDDIHRAQGLSEAEECLMTKCEKQRLPGSFESAKR